MELVEKNRRMKVPSTGSKDTLIKAFRALEEFMKQFIQSLEDKPQGKAAIRRTCNPYQTLMSFMVSIDSDRSFNRSIAPSTIEKMPGTFDFDNAPSDSNSMTSDEPSMQTTSAAAAPVFLKGSSFDNDIPESPHALQHEKEPALDLPSPLPQMNDTATDFMSGGLKPISNRNLNGDDAKPNNAYENDTLRSNVLDALRNAALNDTEMDEDDSKEREILSEEDSRERAIPSDSFSKQSSDTDSKLEPTTATSGPRDINAEEALVPLAASVATVAAAAAATPLSENSKSDSHSANPFDTTSASTHVPETFQGGLGGDSSEPFIKNAKDTEFKPEDQPSFGAEQAKLNMSNGDDEESGDRMDAAAFGTHPSLPKSDESKQFNKESKPFEREAFQGGLGGNGAEPFIKNEKNTLLKPKDQPSFGAAEHERTSKPSSADEGQTHLNDMERPQASSTSTNKGPAFVPESFQGGLGGDGTEPYIKNEKDTLLRPEDQPSFGAEQEKIRRLSEADNENESTDNLNDNESFPSFGSSLSKMGAGTSGIAGAAALGLSEHRDAIDKSKDRNMASSPLDDASSHNSVSPRNVYSPSLASGNSLEDASSPSDVISNEALDSIANKVDADVKRDGLHDNSTWLDKDGVISSEALDKTADNLDAAIEDNRAPSSVSMDVPFHEDVHVLVEQNTSLPPNIGNEVDIETANNDRNRSPLSEKAAPSPAASGNNDSAAASSGLNHDYIGGSSIAPDSTSRAASVTNTAVSSNLPLDAATNAPSASLSARSLTPNDATKGISSKDSPEDDTNNKNEKPGFFKRLFGARSKSPEPASRSTTLNDSDKAASKESTSFPEDKKDIFSSPDAPITDKIHAFNVNVPQAIVNVDADSLNSNTLGERLPNAHGADSSLGSPEINANDRLETSFVIPKFDNRMNPLEFDTNANANVNTSDLMPSLEKTSGDIKEFSNNVSGKFGSSAGSPDAKNAQLSSFDAKLSGPDADLPSVDNKLDGSIKSPDVDATLPSLNADMKSPDIDKSTFDGKSSGSENVPDTEGKISSLNAGLEGPTNSGLPTTELPNLGGKFDRSINTSDVDSDVKSPSANANANLDASGLSGSLGKLSDGLEGIKSDFSGKFDDSIDSLSTGGNVPSLDADLKNSSMSFPDANARLDGSMKTPVIDGKLSSFSSDIKTPSVDIPDIDNSLKTSDLDAKAPSIENDMKSPSFNADMERPDISGSLGELSSLKDIKKDMSGEINSPMNTPDIHGGSSSLNAGLKEQNVELPGIGATLPSLDADLNTPNLNKPSFDGSFNTPDVDSKLSGVNTTVSALNVDIPNAGDRIDRSIHAPGVDMKLPGFNATPDVNIDDSNSSGSLLGKLSAGLKNLKDDISGKLEGSADAPDVDGELPNVDAKINTETDLPHIDASSSSDLKTPKLGKPSVDGKDTPTLSGKLPSLDTELKSPDIDLPNVSGKLDRSISAPDVNSDVNSSSFDADLNVNTSGLSGSLDKLSAGLRGLKDDISGKLDGSIESPHVDGKASGFGANIKGPSGDLPNISGTLDSSVETPAINEELPSLSSDIKTPSADMPHVGGKLDGPVKSPDFNGEIPSVDGDLTSPAFGANVNVDRPDLSGSLGKLSSSFRDLKDDISGKLSGDTPRADSEVPSFSADLKKPELPNVNTDLPTLDTDLSTPKVDKSALDANLPNITGKLDRSISAPDVNAGVKNPGLNSDVGVGATGVSASLGKLSGGLASLKSGISSKLDGPINTPDIDGKSPTIDANLQGSGADLHYVGDKLDGSLKTPDMEGKLPSLESNKKISDADLPNVDTDLNGSINTPDISAKLPSLEGSLKTPDVNLDTDVDASRPSLSGSLGKLSSSFKDFKKDISGKFDSSVDTPNVDENLPKLDADIKTGLPDIHKELPSLNEDLKAPQIDTPDINKDLPSLDTELKTPNANLDTTADVSRPSLSGSLGNLSSSFKDLKKDLSGKFNGSVDTPKVGTKLPSIGADMKSRDVELPDVHKELPSLETDLKTPKLEKPSLNADINTKLHAIEGGLEAPDANVDANIGAARPSVSGLGKLSSSFKDLKDSISGKFNGSADQTPQVDGELPSLSTELTDPNGKLPSLDANLSGVKLGMPSIDGKLTNYLDPPPSDVKLPALDADDLKKPDVALPNVSGKLDGSLDTPEIDSDAKLSGLNANVDMDTSSLSGSLGKLFAGLKDLQHDISGKLEGSVKSPQIDDKLPTFDASIKGSSAGLPDVSGNLDGSIKTPNIQGKLPSLGSPDMKTPHFDTELPSINGDMKTSDVNLDANADIDRPSLSVTLGKLSSSFEGLKDSFSGKISGDSPSANSELPSVNVDLDKPNVDLPGVDGKTSSLDANIKKPELKKPSLDGSLVGSLGASSIDGKLPSVDMDAKAPNVDLPQVSGKLDRSINAPGVDDDMKLPKFNANVDAETSSVSGPLGNLSASLKGFKDDISGKLDGSLESPKVEGKFATLDTNLNGPSVDLPDVGGKLDDSVRTPDYDGKLSSLDTGFNAPYVDMPATEGKYDGSVHADLSSPKANLPNVGGKLDRSIGTPDMEARLPSIEGDLNSPKADADVDVNAERPSLSGALGKLSSSFKGLKDDITGVFSGSVDTPDADDELPSVNTDYTSSKFGLPDADLGLEGSIDTPNLSGDLSKGAELNAPHFNNLSSGHNINLNASIKTPDVQDDISGNLPSLDGNMTAPKADVDVPDLHSPNLDASVEGNASTTVPVAPPRKIGLSGSLGKIDAGLNTPKNDVDVPQADAHTDVPIAPPRSPRLSLNKLFSDAHLDGSSNRDVDGPEASSGFKGPTFSVHLNDKPALEGDLSSGLHSTASDNDDYKTHNEGPSSSFFSKPEEKMSGANTNSLMGDGDDELSQDDDQAHNTNKTTSGYAHLRTRSRTESPEDLSAMLDDIVKRRFSDTPSEFDVSSSLKSDKKARKEKSTSGKSRQMVSAIHTEYTYIIIDIGCRMLPLLASVRVSLSLMLLLMVTDLAHLSLILASRNLMSSKAMLLNTQRLSPAQSCLMQLLLIVQALLLLPLSLQLLWTRWMIWNLTSRSNWMPCLSLLAKRLKCLLTRRINSLPLPGRIAPPSAYNPHPSTIARLQMPSKASMTT